MALATYVVIAVGFVILYFLVFRGCSLLYSDEIIGLTNSYRVIWIDGRYGGGKTSLAHMLAYELLKSGKYKYLVSNVNSVWRDKREDIKPDADKRLNCVVILDEGGLFIDDPRKAQRFKTALRKLNVVVITPSVEPPSSRMKFITVQRELSFEFVGLPAYLYRWSLKKGMVTEKGRFAWWKPAGIFGIYDTSQNPMSDSGIAGFLIEAAERVNKDVVGYLYSEDVLGIEDGSSEVSGAAQAMLEAADNLAMAGEEIASASAKFTRRRR